REGIPFVKVGGFKFMDSAHIKDVLAHLKVIHNPDDSISWYRILLLPISILLRATEAMQAVLDEIHTEGTPRIPASGGESDHDPFAAFNQFVGLPEILDLQRQFTS
ncbi:MAG: hypothetical protein GY713_16920, partial [Actinomycetia bacterium]|nr:hypothetical protein [Actinomycetes bacterium]